MTAKSLSEWTTNKYRMEEQWLWYIAGAFDTHGTITVNFREDSRLKVGYYTNPRLLFSRPKESQAVLGLFDEYADDLGIDTYITEQETTLRIEVEGSDDVETFLEPIVGGFIQQKERAEILLDEVIPFFEGGQPNDKEKFMELVEKVSEMREHPNKSRAKTQYTPEYFRKKLY